MNLGELQSLRNKAERCISQDIAKVVIRFGADIEGLSRQLFAPTSGTKNGPVNRGFLASTPEQAGADFAEKIFNNSYATLAPFLNRPSRSDD
jgi:hypothetical protein